jgi:hypothetical protein
MQNVAETHETPVRAASGGPLGPGVVCVVQVAADAADAMSTPSETARSRPRRT